MHRQKSSLIIPVIVIVTLGFCFFNYKHFGGYFSSQSQKDTVQNSEGQTANNEKNEEVAKAQKTPLKIDGVIKFTKTDNLGNEYQSGQNYVVIFDPQSPKLSFDVAVGVEKNGQNTARNFDTLVSNKVSSTPNSKKLIAAINADYIDTEGKPQGLNIAQGVEHSGSFGNLRSSFGIGSNGQATIQIGKRAQDYLNYNVVGGNGRFYTDGKFKDICEDLGDYACEQDTERSMAAITSDGWVILLVHHEYLTDTLLPKDFKPLLESIAKNNNLGQIKDAMLFDGGSSPNLYYDGQKYVSNFGPIGSALLIYQN